jgi:hypothetical protein
LGNSNFFSPECIDSFDSDLEGIMKKWETEEQAWDEYKALNNKWLKVVELKVKADKLLTEWIEEEKERYENDIKPLMPYIKDRILEEMEELNHKYREAPTAEDVAKSEAE